MRTNSRVRFLAWLCVVAILVASASPAGAGLPQTILAPAAPILCAPVAFSRLRAAEETAPPSLLVLRGVAARAPPLA